MKTSLVRTLTFGTLLLTFSLTSCADPYGYGGGGYGGYNHGYSGGGYGRSSSGGTVAGALIGAGAGGIIGNQRHRGLEGAAIGGILGALAGSMLSNGQRGYPQQASYAQQGYGQRNCNPGYNQGYGQPQPSYGYGQQGGYHQSYSGHQGGYYPNSGYSQQPPINSNNPYAFGNWQ